MVDSFADTTVLLACSEEIGHFFKILFHLTRSDNIAADALESIDSIGMPVVITPEELATE